MKNKETLISYWTDYLERKNMDKYHAKETAMIIADEIEEVYSKAIGNSADNVFLEKINSLMWETWGIKSEEFGRKEGAAIMEILNEWAASDKPIDIHDKYEGYCPKCKSVIKTNIQGNEIGTHDCKPIDKVSEAVDESKLKDFFDAGYDYRSSLLPETINVFGENSQPDFKLFLKEYKEDNAAQLKQKIIDVSNECAGCGRHKNHCVCP